MEKTLPDSAHYVKLSAIDPADGGRWDVRMSNQRIEQVGKRTRADALELAYVLPHVLLHPTAIFEGLRWDEDEDRYGVGWLCYCGKPPLAFDRHGNRVPPWPSEVYLVFLNEQRVAYNNRWEPCEEGQDGLPVGCGNRFSKRLL